MISNSEENSLFFHSQQSTYGARDSCDLKATCCSVAYQLPKSCFVFVPGVAKAESVRFWNEPGSSPIILCLLLHCEGICEFKNFRVQLVLLHSPKVVCFPV